MATNNQKTNKQKYNQQIKRIRKIYDKINAQEGTYLNKSFEDIVGTTPKRITSKTIERLKEIKPRTLQSQAEYKDLETGKTITYHEFKQLMEKPSNLNTSDINVTNMSTESAPTLSIIDRLHNMINSLPNAVTTYLTNGVTTLRDMSDIKFYLNDCIDYNYMKYETEYLNELQSKEELIVAELEKLNVLGMYEAEFTGTTNKLQTYINFGNIFYDEEENSYLLNSVYGKGRKE